MTREEIQRLIELAKEVRAIGGQGVNVDVHRCTTEDLAHAEELGGRRSSFENEGITINVVTVGDHILQLFERDEADDAVDAIGVEVVL